MRQQKTVGFLLKRVDCNDGVASHCEILIRGLRAAGWRVVLITGAVHYDVASVRRFEVLNDLVEDWVVFEQIKPLLPSVACIRSITEIVKKHEMSLFHVHGYSMLLLANILRMVTGLQCIATFHPSLHSDDPTMLKEAVLRPKTRKYQLYLRAFAPKAFIALSSDIERFLIQDLGFPRTKVRKIIAGTDTKYFRPPSPEERRRVREKMKLQEEDLVCSLVGRLNWNKGHDILIKAIRQTRKLLPGRTLKCLISGSGDQEKQIKEYALASDDDSGCFLFLGYVEDLREVYWASDIFALPSRSEGFALVVAEAMCCGTVPIRTPGGGARDQIEEEKRGYIIPFDDVEALSKAIQKLANRDFRLQMGQRCAEYASLVFDQELMVKRTVELYSEFCKIGARESLEA